MTVREWFRVQRGALYSSQPDVAHACEIIASAICTKTIRERGWLMVGPAFGLIFSEEERATQETIERVRRQMDYEIRRSLFLSDFSDLSK